MSACHGLLSGILHGQLNQIAFDADNAAFVVAVAGRPRAACKSDTYSATCSIFILYSIPFLHSVLCFIRTCSFYG